VNDIEVDVFLDELLLRDAERYALIGRIRKLIFSVAPKAREEIRYGGLFYSMRTPFCSVASYTGHVSLEFSRGAELADRHHALEGDGKIRRHIKIDKVGDLFKKNVREYLELAVAVAAVAPPKGKGKGKDPSPDAARGPADPD
jgi:hypothetical protein